MSVLRICCLLGAVLFFSLIAFAQVPVMTQWWNAPIVGDLGLSDQQRQEIRATVRESRERLIELRAAVQLAEAELQDEMDEEKVDIDRAYAAIEKVVAARSELMRDVSQMSLKLRMILTAEQWHELQKRERRRANAPAILGPGNGAPGQLPRLSPGTNEPRRR